MTAFEIYPSMPWGRFQRQFYARWHQGEHVLAIASTGGGKTVLLSRLLPRRKYVVVFATKVRDREYKKQFLDHGYKRITNWNQVRWVRADQTRREFFWPKPGRTIEDTYRIQREVFKAGLDRIARVGSWTVVMDEMYYMCDDLKLERQVKWYLHQSRSSDLTMVNATQRPAFIPIVAYTSTTHAFVWKTDQEDDLKRLSHLGGVDRKQLAYNIQGLREHEFVYVNTRRKAPIVRSEVIL